MVTIRLKRIRNDKCTALVVTRAPKRIKDAFRNNMTSVCVIRFDRFVTTNNLRCAKTIRLNRSVTSQNGIDQQLSSVSAPL